MWWCGWMTHMTNPTHHSRHSWSILLDCRHSWPIPLPLWIVLTSPAHCQRHLTNPAPFVDTHLVSMCCLYMANSAHCWPWPIPSPPAVTLDWSHPFFQTLATNSTCSHRNSWLTPPLPSHSINAQFCIMLKTILTSPTHSYRHSWPNSQHFWDSLKQSLPFSQTLLTTHDLTRSSSNLKQLGNVLF